MPFGEGVTAARFQVVFECNRFFFGFKSNINFYFPRFEFGGMWNFSGIVFGKTGSQIFRNSGITMRFRRDIDQ